MKTKNKLVLFYYLITMRKEEEFKSYIEIYHKKKP